MKKKNVAIWAFALMSAILLLITAQGEADSYGLSQTEILVYEELQKCIDEGDYIAFAETLLQSEDSLNAFACLVKEDAQLVNDVLVDAMIYLGDKCEVETIVDLRINGFVTDDCFIESWNITGYENSYEMNKIDAVDHYLVCELYRIYHFDDYAIRGMQNMRANGKINDDMHCALVDVLGFDYTDEEYMDENGISPLRTLEPEEKAIYEMVQKMIDEGDHQSIIKMMLFNEINSDVYACLIQSDMDVLELIIAQSMVDLAEAQEFKSIVQLRINGYISDKCFEYYWENLDVEPLSYENKNETEMDQYLLHELKRIATCNNGLEILKEIWYMGMIGDNVQEQLIAYIGYDYT